MSTVPALFRNPWALLVLLLSFVLGGCGEMRPEGSHYYLSHEVKPGETLYSIAWRFGYDYREVAAWNRIRAPYRIFPGQRLLILAPDRYNVPDGPPPGAERVAVASIPASPPQTAPGTSPASGVAAPPVPKPGRAADPPAQAKPRPPATRSAQAKPPSSAVPPAKAKGSGSVPPSGRTAKPPAKPAPTSKPAAAPRKPVQPAKPAVGRQAPALAAASAIKWQWPTDGKIVARFAAGQGRKGIDVSGRVGQPVRAAAEGVVVYSGNGLIGYGNLVIVKHSEIYLSAYAHNRRLLVKEGDKVKMGATLAEMGQSSKGSPILHFEIRKNGKPIDPLLYLPDKAT